MRWSVAGGCLFVTAALGALVGAGCEDPGIAKVTCDIEVPDEPIGDCLNDDDCPQGAICARSSPGEPTRCEIGGQHVGATPLINEMNVRKLDIQVNVAGPLVVSWVNDASFRAVTCALFRCEPMLERCSDGHARITSASMQRCVVRSQTVEPPDASIEFSGFAVSVCGEPGEQRPPPVTAPAVACWAYDDTSLARASKLIGIDPADPPLHIQNECGSTLHDGDCLCGANLCSCRDGECAPRCLADADCPAPRPHCTYSEDGSKECGFVGVCVAGPESP